MSSAADVTDLQQQRSTEPFLDIEVVIVVVGVAEILADRKNVIDPSATIARGAQASGNGENRLAGYDGAGASDGSNSIHRAATGRITFQAVGSTVRGAVVEERIQIGRVEINSKSRPDHEVATFLGLIGESQSWSKVFKVLWICAGDASVLEDQTTFAGNKYG